MWISQRISPLHMWVFYQISCGTSVSLPLERKPFSWQSNCHASTTAIVCPLLNHALGEHGSLPYTTMGVTNTHVVESLFNHMDEKTRESSLFYLAGSTNKHYTHLVEPLLNHGWERAWESYSFYLVGPTNEHFSLNHWL